MWARPLARPRDGDQQVFFALYASHIRTPHERRTQLHPIASPGGGLARGRASVEWPGFAPDIDHSTDANRMSNLISPVDSHQAPFGLKPVI